MTTIITAMHNRTTMPAKHASGQILVLVLLVVLVGMSIGLSIASRTLSNLKDTTKLNTSNRAFNAAEAGIEHALTILKGPNPTQCQAPTGCGDTISLAGIDKVKVVTNPIGGNTRAFGIDSLNRDEVIQVNLEGYTGSSIKAYWGSNTKTGCTDSPAIVVSVVYRLSNGTYSMSKSALDDCATDASHANNFNDATVSPASGTVTLQDGTTRSNYRYMATLDFSSGDLQIPSGATMLLARVRLMYGSSTEPIAIAPVGSGVTLPTQGQQITSTAVAGQTQRTVKVVRSNTNLPAIFDYALFNGSTQALSKN